MRKALKKGTLRLGRHNSGYLIATDRVIIWVKDEHVHPKIKAVVAELLEFLPDHKPDVLYQVRSGSEPVLVVDPASIFALVDTSFTPLEEFIVSPVSLLDRGYPTRLLQDTRSGKIRGTLQEHLDLIDRKYLDYNVEGDPTGPFANPSGSFLYYTNGTAKIGFIPHVYEVDQSKETINLLGMVDYTRDEN